jgi:hypothetical protein
MSQLHDLLRSGAEETGQDLDLVVATVRRVAIADIRADLALATGEGIALVDQALEDLELEQRFREAVHHILAMATSEDWARTLQGTPDLAVTLFGHLRVARPWNERGELLELSGELLGWVTRAGRTDAPDPRAWAWSVVDGECELHWAETEQLARARVEARCRELGWALAGAAVAP